MSSTTSWRPCAAPGERSSPGPGAEGDRARGAGRRDLHEAQLVRDLVIVVGVEAGLLDVERLRAVDVGDGEGDQLEPVVH
jgi:hypothetical protein